jgi:hypothetical protein
MKHGRKAIKTDTRTLALRKYLKPSLPALGQNWLTVKGSPDGFDENQLKTDLSCIK